MKLKYLPSKRGGFNNIITSVSLPAIRTCGGAALTAAFILGAHSLHAADVVWDGGGDGVSLDQPENWTGDALPSLATPDTGVFDGTAAGDLSLTYGGGLGGSPGNLGLNLQLAGTQTSPVSLDSGLVTGALRLNNITLDSGSGAFTLGDGSDVFNITLGGAGGQTHTWTNNSSNTATIRSDVSFGMGGGGSHVLALTGSGNWAAQNNLAPSNAAVLNLLKTGSGSATLSGGGTFGTGAIGGFGNGTFSAVFRGGTTTLAGGNFTSAGELVVGGVVTNGEAGVNTNLTVDAGSLTVNSWLSIGRGNGTGGVSSDLTLNNSAVVTATNFSGGFNSGSTLNMAKGVITLNDSSRLSVVNAVNIAESAGSDITLNINGGALFEQTANSQQTRLGMADGAVGRINVNGGTATFHRDLIVGSGGTSSGIITLESGTINAATTVKRWLIVGQNNASSGGIVVDGGNLNLNTNTDLRFSTTNTAAGTNVVTLNDGAITSFTGNATGDNGAGVVDLMQSGTATANNTFNLNGGTLAVRQVISATNNGTRTLNFNGGTLRATGDTAALVNLGTGSAFANVRDGGAVIDTNGFSVTVPQALVHSNIVDDAAIDGGLTKTGAGTLTLSGTNTYTGLTTVSAGTLALAAGGSIDDSAGVEIATGATFDVSAKAGYTVGSVTGVGNVVGALTVSTQLSIGNSPGTMAFGGDLTLGTGGAPFANAMFEVVGGGISADLGIVSGTLDLNGVTLDLVQLGSYTFGDTFTLFAASEGVTGTFEGLAEGSSFTAAGGEWMITYSATTEGQNWSGDPTGFTFVNVMAVPEPSVAVLGVLGALALLRRRRA